MTQAVNGTIVVMQPGGLDPMTVFFGSSFMFTAMALVLHALFECGFYDTRRELMANVLERFGGVGRALRLYTYDACLRLCVTSSRVSALA